ncbi:MAG: nitrogen regulation protein NR(II) [Planctomycetota bacterium]
MTGAALPTPAGEASAAMSSFLELHEEEYRRQVQWFLLVRVVVAMACLVVLLIYEEGSPRRFPAAYGLLVAGVALTAAHLFITTLRAEVLDRWVVAAVVVDLCLESALVYLTGGIYNQGFAVLYFGTILSAVLLVSEPAGMLVASAATLAMALTAITYWAAANPGSWGDPAVSVHLPWVPPEFYGAAVDLRWGRVTANLIGAGFALHGVAFLAGRLPYRVSESRLLFDEILERMGEGVVAIDRRGTILLANAEVRRLLHWQHLRAIPGDRFERVLRRREDRAVLELLSKSTDSEAELELPIRGKGMVAVNVRTTVLRDEQGRVRGVIGIFRDLTVHKQLRETERRLARLADTEAMALGIAHEIRNPLGSIRGAIQELTAHALTDPADQKLGSIVRRESDRLDRILQQFLDFARMRPPLRQQLRLSALVEETALLLRSRDESRQVEVEVRVLADHEVEADPDQLRQALLNVALNGLEAAARQGRLRFTVQPAELQALTPTSGGALVAARAALEVSIENDGPRIPAELQEQIFTPFFTTKRGGLGLGMSITQKILRAHGGDVWVGDSEELSGARFRIVLPLPDGATRSA